MELPHGTPRDDGLGWAEWARENLPLDPARTHWLGSIQDREYRQLLAVSDVLLSHSALHPELEFVGSYGRRLRHRCQLDPSCLGGFGTRMLSIIGGLFDETAHVEALERLLDSPSLRIEIGDKARQRAAFYDQQRGLDAGLNC